MAAEGEQQNGYDDPDHEESEDERNIEEGLTQGRVEEEEDDDDDEKDELSAGEDEDDEEGGSPKGHKRPRLNNDNDDDAKSDIDNEAPKKKRTGMLPRDKDG